ncbi:hypothetical protein M3G43_04435 [Brevibacterium casei]|uniref:hypothetical protein n=1 Tax=Brevibacterium casei TaxID=33889 RepID=UPI00223B8A62|nr:hypothetical protein [Brevibacterium casei]MCT1446504.1 hypothetical protein [Brevibacterium casei]
MDTSIIVVIAIVVAFVVVVPSMIRRSATELSRADLDRLPADAEVVRSESQNPCRDLGERVTVFRTEGTEPTVPSADRTASGQAPNLRLSAVSPELSVIDGEADETAEATAESQPESAVAPLPVAVGETRAAFLVGDHDSAGGGVHAPAEAVGGNVRALHPAVHAVFAPTGDPSAQRGSSPAGVDAAGRLGAGRQQATSAGRTAHPSAPRDRLGEVHSPTTAPTSRPDEDPTMTESAAPLRESLRSIGTLVRGFALTFLGSVLGVLVTGVLALLSVVHPALIGVFAGLAVVSLFIVRTLNLRKRELKKRLRRIADHGAVTAEPVPTRGSQDAFDSSAPSAASARPAAPESASRQTPTSAAPKSAASKAAAHAQRTATRTAAKSTAANSDSAKSDGGTSAAAKSTGARSTSAARERALQQRSATAKYAREEAVTGEIPVVRIRNEAAAGHTTRQVLLTGPIPVTDEKPTAEAPATPEAQSTAQTATSEATKSTSPATTDADVESATSADTSANAVAADLADTVPQAASRTEDSSTTGAPRVSDPFQQRLRTRDGWSPTPLPVPSYVDAAEADHAVPTPKAADASSYETEARSREDIAAQFAEELGYRAELSDSARDDSPLEHGRKAIRADRAPALDAVNDVLARRRA